ncbi:type II toxin-antitoxin system HigB family toxin [Dyadobacter sp. CY347]|uniref:type II toxin-antitoxin system HigB family toxin n=1 Tax=Dyadobacter sp. CY347 TaxID=2909336 RepID=UPI001F315F1E|nr:type II toxin-antitoxin system HigB family toxin [Dyadobacter sp. CY347]MCF2488198.1 type II toxin-antitoxin system HigB family toxin [Dyadobacter sp. CY347]
MKLLGKHILSKLKKKNRGNTKLSDEIDRLVSDLESTRVQSDADFRAIRSDAEKVQNSGFYFLDIHIHRALLLLVIKDDEASIVWVGTHSEYERIFKNNKNSIEKWLRNKDLL